PYLHGRALWGMLTSPLPGKQLDARSIIAEEMRQPGEQEPTSSLVSSIFGPWYLDFGIPGVVLGLVLLGFLLGRVEQAVSTRGEPLGRGVRLFPHHKRSRES